MLAMRLARVRNEPSQAVTLGSAVTGAPAGDFAGVSLRRSISRRMSFIGSSERTRGITSKSCTSSEPTANGRAIGATVYKARLGKQAATVLAFFHYGFENNLGKPAR